MELTNKEIAKAITDRLLDRHIVMHRGRSQVEHEIEYALLGLRVDPWPEELSSKKET